LKRLPADFSFDMGCEMSEQQTQHEEEGAPSVPMANAWAMTTVLAFFTAAVIASFFMAQTVLFGRLSEAQAATSRQQHCIAVRRACHNQELTPQLCGLRQRAQLDPRSFGPTIEGEFQGVSCPESPPRQRGLCDLLRSVETPTCNPSEDGGPD
jgi:hypothetical protein